MIVSKIRINRGRTFCVLVADLETEEIGVSNFSDYKDATEFHGLCHMFNRIDGEYDDGQGRKYDILDSELE